MALFNRIHSQMDFVISLSEDEAKNGNTNFFRPTSEPVSRIDFYKNLEELNYRSFVMRTFLNRTSMKKLFISLYGALIPENIRNALRRIR
jgi:hypothetical protein